MWISSRAAWWSLALLGLGSAVVGCQRSGTSDDDGGGAKPLAKDSDADGRSGTKPAKDGGLGGTGAPAAKAAPKLGRWGKHFGSHQADGSNVGFGNVRAEDGRAVAVDAAGNVILVGQFRGSADFGGGPLKAAGAIDVVVAKLDPSGAHQWSKRFGGADDDEGESVGVDAAGNVYVVGRFAGSVDLGGGTFTDKWGGFVLKLDPSGNHLWSRHLAGGIALGLDVTADGGVVVCGNFWKALEVGGQAVKGEGRTSAFVTKLDGSGTKKWLKTFSGTGPAVAVGNAVATHDDGSAYLLSELAGTVDFGGGPLTSAGRDDVVITKLDAGGAHLWSKRFGATSTEYGDGLAVDPTGAVVVTGSFAKPFDFGGEPLISKGGRDVFVAKLDAAGGHVWSRSFGGKEDDSAYDVAVDRNGTIALTGAFKQRADFGGKPLESRGKRDAFILRLDVAGQPAWSKRLGGSDDDYGHGVTIDGTGAIVATGHFVGKATYSGGELTSNGGHDIYLLSLPD